MERISSAEFAEIVADYGLEPWGDDWQQTAFLASAMSLTKTKKSFKEIIPRAFPALLENQREQIDAESFFRKLTSGIGGQNHD